MDVKTFNEIYEEVAIIQKYFVMVFDKNVFAIWTSLPASKKYYAFTLAVDGFRSLAEVISKNEFDDAYLFEDKKAAYVKELSDFVCKAVFDMDISGYDYAHQIFDEHVLGRFRINAVSSAYKIADIIGLDEDEMINGLD